MFLEIFLFGVETRTEPVHARRNIRSSMTIQEANMMKNCFKSIWLFACCTCVLDVSENNPAVEKYPVVIENEGNPPVS